MVGGLIARARIPPTAARGLPRSHRWAGISALSAFVLFSAANATWAFEQPAPVLQLRGSALGINSRSEMHDALP